MALGKINKIKSGTAIIMAKSYDTVGVNIKLHIEKALHHIEYKQVMLKGLDKESYQLNFAIKELKSAIKLLNKGE